MIMDKMEVGKMESWIMHMHCTSKSSKWGGSTVGGEWSYDQLTGSPLRGKRRLVEGAGSGLSTRLT
jgi:hypothetical protein